MTVGIVGDGPAAMAVEAALADVDTKTTRTDPGGVGDTTLAVVIDTAGASTFDRANDHARSTGSRWLAVELGGVGGAPLVDAAVSGLGHPGPCFECLRGRVAANETDTEDTDAPDTEIPTPTTRYAGAIAGRLAARAVTAEYSVVGRLTEVDGPERTVLPLPNCACSAAPDAGLPRDRTQRSLDAALERAERGLDGRVGILTEVGEIESVPLPYYLAQACETAGFSDVSASHDAAGVALGWDEAFMKALGEGLERYAAGVYRDASLRHGTPEEVPDAVALSTVVGRDDGPVDGSLPWVPGEALGSGEAVHLPAELVHYPPLQERLRPAITTGLGLGNDAAEALVTGLCEVIERDAAMLAWYSTYQPLGLAVEDDAYTAMGRRARAADLSVRTVLLTQDVDVPVVAVAVDRDEWPRCAVGSSAAFDPAGAARGALAEALQNWMELDGMGREAATEAAGRIGQYAADPGPARSFFDAETTVPASSVGREAVPEGWAAVDALVDALAAAGLEAYGARLTTVDLAALGFEAARAVVPGAQPLFFETPYFGDRARSVPRRLGYDPRPDRRHHPFP